MSCYAATADMVDALQGRRLFSPACAVDERALQTRDASHHVLLPTMYLYLYEFLHPKDPERKVFKTAWTRTFGNIKGKTILAQGNLIARSYR